MKAEHRWQEYRNQPPSWNVSTAIKTNQNEWKGHTVNTITVVLSRWILTFWDFYQKKKILSNVFLEWVSQAVVTMGGSWNSIHRRPSGWGRLPLPFPLRVLSTAQDVSHCTEKLLSQQWQRYSPSWGPWRTPLQLCQASREEHDTFVSLECFVPQSRQDADPET